MHTNPHNKYLLQALNLAQKQRGFCSPNPAVGSLIIDINGEVLAEGYHAGPGAPHAEIHALTALKGKPNESMTLYVTLEPCNHWGRTPPCSKKIIESGIRRVVYGYQDPNPFVAGNGGRELLQAGIDCLFINVPEIDFFYKSYNYWLCHKLPFVTAKLAMTLNGKIAGCNGERIQITGNELAMLTHQYRKNSDAILTSARTVILDDPLLNVRCGNDIFAKPLYVLDRNLSIQENAKIFQTAKSITVFYSSKYDQKKYSTSRNANLRYVPIDEKNNFLDLYSILTEIGKDGVHDLWVEAGGKLFASFLKNNLAQKLIFYIAPIWIDDGLKAFEEQNINLNKYLIKWDQHGNDVAGVFELY